MHDFKIGRKKLFTLFREELKLLLYINIFSWYALFLTNFVFIENILNSIKEREVRSEERNSNGYLNPRRNLNKQNFTVSASKNNQNFENNATNFATKDNENK